MNKRISEILNYISFKKIKNDQRIVIFAICLLIATGLWFLDALGKNYSATVSYPVRYINPPENLFLISQPPSKFELTVEAHGFTLLRHKLSLSSSPIILNLNSITQNSSGKGSTYTLRTETLIRHISEQISNEITIIDISPNTIELAFDSLASKKVPVTASVQTEFKPQFYRRGIITVEPESLRISGPASVLDTIHYLKTKHTKITEIDSDIEKRVQLSPPKKTSLSEKTVTLKIPVEKFTEKKINLPIQVKNKPLEARIKLFPSEAEVSFLVGLSDYENINSSDFKAFVDYKQAGSNRETLDVIIDKQPPFIKIFRVSPQSVEFLIEHD
jgi:hypothetical protein